MEAKDYLAFIVNVIHTVVTATVDADGLPVTCAIDMMDSDGSGLYFLTAKGKSFYRRLKSAGYMALTGIKGEGTLSSVSVSVRGKTEELGPDALPELFEKNPYMKDIYPHEASRSTLTVFRLYAGTGEWFDLSKKPVERKGFSFGSAEKTAQRYHINDSCIGCRLCYGKCPQKCIDISGKPAVIIQQNCLHCGNCSMICPVGAVERRGA